MTASHGVSHSCYTLAEVSYHAPMPFEREHVSPRPALLFPHRLRAVLVTSGPIFYATELGCIGRGNPLSILELLFSKLGTCVPDTIGSPGYQDSSYVFSLRVVSQCTGYSFRRGCGAG